MGDAYKLPIDGSSPNNLYGLAWSHPNAGGQAGFLNDHGLLVMQNGLTNTAISSRIWVRDYVDATYYRDRESTGYYLNPAGDRDSNINGFNQSTQARMGITGRYNYWRPYITGDQVYWTGQMGWGSYTFNEMLGWGSGFIDSWGSAGAQNRPGDTSHHVGIQTFHWSNGSNAYGWQMIGGVNENLWWRYSWNSPSGWYKVAMYDNNTNADRGFYAAVYYDAQSTGYYLDPHNTDNQGLRIRGGALHGPNWSWGKYLYVGSNGRVSGDGSVVITNGNLHLDCENGYETYINHYSGNVTYIYDTRVSILRARSNTGYYVQPQDYSQLSSGEFNNYLRVARLDFVGTGGNSGQGTNAYSIFQEGGGWGYPYPDLRIAYHTGLKFGANAGSYEGVRLYSDYDMSGILIQLSGSSNYSFWHTWQRLEGYHGIYSGYNSAHIYPNNSTYGQWRIDGSRNGYGGILIDVGNTPVLMFDGGGNGGIYYQSGRWLMYHYFPYNCVGINTSSTSPSYGMYVYRGIYATENIVAYSDRRAKENIQTIDSALDKVLQLRGVYYNRIDDVSKKRQVGVIAQEVEEILPEVVTYCDVNDEYGVAYGNLSGILIEAVKEQNKIIEKQSDEIKELKEILNNLILNIKG
jgi:hypothetical protein